LVAQAVAGALAAFDLAHAGEVTLEEFDVLVVHLVDFIGTEAADFL